MENNDAHQSSHSATSHSLPLPTDPAEEQPQGSNAHATETIVDHTDQRSYGMTEIYPCLGEVPQLWRDLLKLVGELSDTHYLLVGAESPETRRLCATLPSILDAFTQVVSRATGAFIHTKAVWRDIDTDTSLSAYSAMTKTAQDQQTVAEAKDSIARLVHHLSNGLGPFMERKTERTYPVVYGSLQLNGRPQLPPPHPNPLQRRATVDNFLFSCFRWQGIPALSWRDISDRIGTENPPFDPARSEASIDWSIPVLQWSMEMIDRFYTGELYHERRIRQGHMDSMDKAFQWLRERVGEPYQLQPGPSGPGIYNVDQAAYCLAVKKFCFGDDAYMPPSPDPRKWFTAEVMQELGSLVDEDMSEFIHWVEVNEKRSPPIRPHAETDHPLLRRMVLRGAKIPIFVDFFQVPRSLYDFTLEGHDLHNLRALWNLVVVENIFVLPDGVAGGETGVFSVVLLLLIISKLIEAMKSGTLVLGPTESPISREYGDGKAITFIIQHLVTQLKSASRSGSHPQIFQGTLSDKWRPEYVDVGLSGYEGRVKMMWPYGMYGEDLTLTGIIPESLPPASSDPGKASSQASVIEIDEADDEVTAAVSAPAVRLSTPSLAPAELIHTTVPATPARLNVEKGKGRELPSGEESAIPTSTASDIPRTRVRPPIKVTQPSTGPEDDVYALFKMAGLIRTKSDCSVLTISQSVGQKQVPALPEPPSTFVPENVIGPDRGKAEVDSTFGDPSWASTPHGQSCLASFKPMGPSSATSRGSTDSPSTLTSRPVLSALKTSGINNPASSQKAVSPSSLPLPPSASSASRNTPVDDTATGSLLGRAAGAIARSSPIISPNTQEDDAGGSRQRTTAVMGTRRVTRGTLKRGHEGEAVSSPKVGKKQRSASKTTPGDEEEIS